jgi:signal transduction histidine kinase/DNA-binding response OmpR family regulator
MSADEKINILIVDDLPDKLLVLESILEELGENLVKANSGAEALRLVLERDFAVILLDVYMPGMSGFETAGLIRQRRKSAHTPIIFITAFADEMHTAQGYSMGAVDYILSPVVPEILRTKVKVFVDLYRMTQQAKRQADERVALAREQTARAAAEEAMRRSTFLAEASKVLSSSLDTEATRRGLLRLVVPYIADMAGVALLTEAGSERKSEFAWLSPRDRQVHFGSLAGSPRTLSALERVLAGGPTEVLEGLALPYPESNGDVEPDDDERRLRHAILLPLQARGRTLGALMLGQGQSARLFSSVERALAEDLAARAAIALDNARLYRNVQEADRHKNEFLSMLSHELRNPLTPIRNAIQILQGHGSKEPEIASLYTMIDRQLRHLTRLVDDLLDLSRITRGKIHLKMESVAAADIVARAVEMSRPLIDSRKHELTVSLPPEPLYVRGDPVRLAQSIGNLLNNAAKYTEDGGRIDVRVESSEDDVVTFCVRDNGMGIPSDMLSSVFELFKQVDRSLDRSQGGLGIGLTLVNKLIGMHGGRVEAFSAGLNQGSEFVVQLPIWRGEESPPVPDATHIPAVATSTRRRVLIVDDNTDAAHSLAMLMEVGGHEAHLCYDGHSALTEAQSFQPEVVLLDIGLPGLDGLEVARRLRAMNLSPRPMLVALTGYGQNDDVQRSREAGFDHHLVKPTDPQALIALLASTPKPESCPV